MRIFSSVLRNINNLLSIFVLGSDRSSFIVSKNATLEDLRQTYYIEMACNTLLGNGSPTMISPPDRKRFFTLDLADIACFDRQVKGIYVYLFS